MGHIRIINNCWYSDLGIGYITVSFDGKEYEYEINGRYWYDKLINARKYNNSWVYDLKKFPSKRILKGNHDGV